MSILCQRGAWYQAKILYEEGYNGLEVGKNDGWLNLQALAQETFTHEKGALTSLFVEYYGNETYKHNMMIDALDGLDWYSSAPHSGAGHSFLNRLIFPLSSTL